jgi:hypothetical protein
MPSPFVRPSPPAPHPLRRLCLTAATGAVLAAALLVLRPVAGVGTLMPASAGSAPSPTQRASAFDTPADIPLSAEQIAAAAGAPSDRALAAYFAAACRLEEGGNDPVAVAKAVAQEDGPILALVDLAAAEPNLVVSQGSGAAPAPATVSSSVVLMRVVKGLCRRAEARAAEGDAHAAAACLDRARAVAAHVLATDTPTLEAVQAVRTLDVLTLRAEERVAQTLGRGGEAARVRSRAQTMAESWRREVRPVMDGAREDRERMIRARADLASSEAADRAAAADLLRRYAAARVRATLTAAVS